MPVLLTGHLACSGTNADVVEDDRSCHVIGVTCRRGSWAPASSCRRRPCLYLGPMPEELPDFVKQARGAGAAASTASALLTAAEQELQESGWHGTTIDRVVRRAGVSRGTFYNYFTDRRDLLHAVAREHAALLMPHLTALYGLEPGPDLETRARVLALAYVRAYRRHPGVARVWSEEIQRDPDLLALARVARDQMASAFDEAFGRSAARIDLPPSAFFLMLSGLTDRFPHQSSLFLDSPAAAQLWSDEAVADVIARFVLAVLSFSARHASARSAEQPRGSAGTA
ncbi:MAG: putative transcriptional regulator [Frankiales bacterium]|nr:putative transcriptional regulator [Frankiales bacterium]